MFIVIYINLYKKSFIINCIFKEKIFIFLKNVLFNFIEELGIWDWGLGPIPIKIKNFNSLK